MPQSEEKRCHPYLVCDKARLEQLRSRIETNRALAQKWESYLELAEKLLDEPFITEEYADGEDSQHGRYGEPSRQMADMGMKLGLAFQVTADHRYAEKLKNALLHYSGYRKWYGKGLLTNDPPWHSELNTSQFCFGFSVGYDFIYEVLEESERQIIREAMIRLGVLPILQDWVFAGTRVHTLDTMGHNWWSVMISHAGLGALAVLDEDSRAAGWLGKILRILPEYFTYKGSVLGNKSPNYDEAGAFYESAGYANYGLYEYLVFRLACREIVGYNRFADIPVLEKAGEFFLHTFYPAEEPFTVNFGDSHLRGSCHEAVKLLLANGLDDPRLRWYLQQCKADYDAYDFLYHDRIREGDVFPPSEQARSVLYPDIGWAVMRNSWEKNGTLLAVKSGFTWNHAHADAGSFLLFHYGKPLLTDSGCCAYGRPEYVKYYTQSRAHNVVLYNGRGQNPEDFYRGGKEPGQVHHLVDHAGWQYVYADATGPMSRFFSRNFRHFLWVDGVILIIDDIRAHEEGALQWLLHYEGKANRLDNGTGTIRITNGDAEARVRVLFPSALRLTEKESFADQDPDRKVPYFSFETPETVRETKFVSAVIPADTANDAPEPELSAFQSRDMLGIRIVRDGKVTEVCLNLRADGRVMHSNSIRMLNGWETDAYLIAVTRPADAREDDLAAIERCLICYGSFLRRSGYSLFSSLSKTTVSIEFDPRELSVSIQGQPEIRAELRPAAIPGRLSVNGRSADVERSGGVIAIRHSASMPARRPG